MPNTTKLSRLILTLKTNKMKHILSIISLTLLSSAMSGQVIIGEGKTDVSSPSISLEFGTENKGLVLPWVNSANSVTKAVNGTLVLDTSDKKVKIKLNTGWKDLSRASTSPLDTSLQDGLTDNESAKVSIGNPTNTPGILVLEDNNKAMQLPMVASPHLNIANPTSGMIVYDTTSKLVCIFNGAEWSFWKGEEETSISIR